MKILAFFAGILHVVTETVRAEPLPHYDNWRDQGLAYTCGATCQITLKPIIFKDEPPGTEWTELCQSRLRAQSTYECIDLYCKPYEIAPGEHYVVDYCKTYGSFEMLSYDDFDHSLTRDELFGRAVADEKVWDDISVSGEPIDRPIIPYPAKYQIFYKTVAALIWVEDLAKIYGWAMYGFWAAVVLISLITKVLHKREQEASESKRSAWGKFKVKFNYMILTPATLGKRSTEPYGWCTVPPLIESLTIFVFVAINIVLCCVYYSSFEGNTYYPLESAQIWRYIGDKVGIVAVANLPIVWLFSQRNNVLLWIVGWKSSTFNNFHRWVARVVVVEAILHAISRTIWMFKVGGYENYASYWEDDYTIWGAVATILISLMVVVSSGILRSKAYDVFLYVHFVFAFMILVALFYHVRVYKTLEYYGYLWACVAIWTFDRVLRLCRIVALNFHSKSATAYYSEKSQLIRVDVPINPIHLKGSFFFVYVLHGPTFFQSHPFTASFAVSTPGRGQLSTMLGDEDAGQEKEEVPEIDHSKLRFFMRPFNGFTRRLRDRLHNEKSVEKSPQTQLRVIVEGPYGKQESLQSFDNILFIAGGSGITVVLQHLQRLPERKATLLWTVRQESLVDDFSTELETYRRLFDDTKIHITGGASDRKSKFKVEEGRPDLRQYILEKRREWSGSMAVVSCSPPAMADDTRRAVVEAMRSTQLDITLLQESFSW